MNLESSGIPQQDAKKKTCAAVAALSTRSNLALPSLDLQLMLALDIKRIKEELVG